MFRADATQRVAAVAAFARGPAPKAVDDDLVRALHTLKGSAEAVHLHQVARLAGALERYADASRAARHGFDAADLKLLEASALALRRPIDDDHGAEPLDVNELVAEAGRRLAGLPATAIASSADRELLIVFTDEACDLVDAIDKGLTDWVKAPQDRHYPRELRTTCHTLKGSARTAAAHAVGEVAQALEAGFAALAQSDAPAQAEIARMREVVDGLYDMLDRFRHGDTALQAAPLLTLLGATAAEPPPLSPPPEEAEPLPLETERPPAEPASLPAEPASLPTVQTAADPELTSVFLDEGRELVEALAHQLAHAQPSAVDDTAARAEMLRLLHTLKGSARMAGVAVVGDLSHELETLLTASAGDGEAARRQAAPLLHAGVDALHQQLDGLARGEAPPAPAEIETAPRPAAAQGDFDPRLAWTPPASGERDRSLPETARVAVEQLETMLNQAGEISIFRARLEQSNAAMQAQLTEMAQTARRLREQLRKLDLETESQILARHEPGADRYQSEFDPLEMDRYSALHELSRGLAESAADLASLHASMGEAADSDEALLAQQARANTALQQSLMGTLMVPFSHQEQRLQRLVRQSAQEHGRVAELAIAGAEAELDRNVLERMVAPLEHLLRNAVIHGIEAPEARRERGKPAAGRLGLNLFRDGTQLVIELQDDGRGLDLDAIRTKAIEAGLLDSAATIDDADLAHFIFEPGFSTASGVTQSAGRGVGMDVVDAQIKGLGGGIAVASSAGRGTRFSIRLPLTLAIGQALLLRVGDETYAAPLGGIEGVTRVARRQLERERAAAEPSLEYGGLRYRLYNLGELLGAPAVPTTDGGPSSYPVLLVRAAERRTAFVVDAMIGSREIVVKPVGPQVASVPGVSGATVMAHGEVVLILDVAALMQRHVRRALAAAPSARAAEAADERPLVLVVDDSITIRRVSERFLSRHGFRVATAKDGMDALAKLQAHPPDLVLLDIEMPRIDGFELATYMRNSESLSETPIVMITSRSGDKHRQRAAALGVARFLTKPYQEQDLLAHIHAVLRQGEGSG